MEQNEYIDLLDQHGIRATANRIVVLRALAGANHPLSLSELVDEVVTIDKSGVFRALSVFREHHLVHVIEGGSDSAKWELCRSHDENRDEDEHVHFYCTHCHRTICLDAIPTPCVILPPGFEQHSANYMVKGLCPRCASMSHLA